MKDNNKTIAIAIADVVSQAISTTGTLIGISLIFCPEFLLRLFGKK